MLQRFKTSKFGRNNNNTRSNVKDQKVNNKNAGSYNKRRNTLATKSEEKAKSVKSKKSMFTKSEDKTRTVRENPTVENVERSKSDGEAVEARVSTNDLTNTAYELFPLNGHAGCVLYILKNTWKNKILCDVTIKVGHQTFQAHRLVLSSCAGYFYDKFCVKRIKSSSLPITTIPPDIMESLLESMYTGYLKLHESNILEILQAARKLRYFTVEQACDEYLQSLVDKDNCFGYLHFANEQGFSGLSEKCMACIASNFEDLSLGQKYLDLELDQMISLLSRDDINASSELTVFDRMLDWINCDIPNRLGCSDELLKEVRLPLMPASDIIDNVENTSYLMEVTECLQLVKEALHYHCLPARQSVLQNSRTRHRTMHQRNVVFAIGGAPKRLVDPVSNDITAYNPSNNQWEFVTYLPNPIHHHSVAVLGGFIYVVGGETENDQKSPLNKAHRFDPRTGSWLRIADMKTARESFQLCVLANMLYAIGGRVDKDRSLSAVESYNPAVDEWMPTAPLTSPRRALAATSHNGRIYIAGGTGDPNKFERYNPLSNSWESRQPLSRSRFFAQLAAVHKYLYLLGGATIDSRGVTSSMTIVEYYCPTSDTWTTLHTRLESRAECGCAVMNNKIYLVGGFDWKVGDRLTSTEVFDVETETVTSLSDIAVPLTGIACCATTICDLKKSPQLLKKPFVESTCDFYHHCSKSVCDIQVSETDIVEPYETKNNNNTSSKVRKSQPNCSSPDVKKKKSSPIANNNIAIKRKRSNTKTTTPRLQQKSTGSKYSQRFRLTRASSCEMTSSKDGNKQEPSLKLPPIIPEARAKRE